MQKRGFSTFVTGTALVLGSSLGVTLAQPRSLWAQTEPALSVMPPSLDASAPATTANVQPSATTNPGTVVGAARPANPVATTSDVNSISPPGPPEQGAASATNQAPTPPVSQPTTTQPVVANAPTTFDLAATGGVAQPGFSNPTSQPVAPAQTPALTPGWSWVDTVAAEPLPPAVAPKRNPFRGSRFDWTHNVTTSTFGVGQDYQSASYRGYQQGFSLLLAYFPYDGDTFRIRVAAAPGMDLVLTNSDLTTTVREPWLRDLPLLVGGSVIVSMQPERLMSTILAPNLAFFLPTSKMSWNSGDYLTVSPRVSVSQQLPLFGQGAAAFDDVDLWLQLRYDHLFSRGATPIDTDLDRPAMSNTGSATSSDVLDGSQNSPNAFRVDLSVAFSEELFGQPLTLSVNADYRLAELYGVAPYSIATDTGSYTVEPSPDARTWRQGVGFGVDATYQLVRTMSVAAGYASCGNEICPARGADLGNATYKSPFYTAHAIFWGGLILHVDTVLDLLINGDKTNSSVLRRDLASTSFAPRF